MPYPRSNPRPFHGRRQRRHAALVVFVALVASAVLAPLAPSRSVEAAGDCWQPPVTAPIVDPFRPPACPWCPGNRGVEYATRPGQPVYAVAAGRVVFSGEVARVGYLTVELPDGRRTSYGGVAHRRAPAGTHVARGQLLGRASATSLHLGVRAPAAPDGVSTRPVYLDPVPSIGRWRVRPRLVPLDARVRRPPAPGLLVCPDGPSDG